jgi:serine/threonine-protein kinase
LGVNLREVQGTGAGGQITVTDIKKAVAETRIDAKMPLGRQQGSTREEHREGRLKKAEEVKAEQGSSASTAASSGPSGVKVPNLTGMSRYEARSMLRSAGLKLGMLTSAPTQLMPEGAIFRQYPPAGKKVERDTFVQITVSSGPTTPITANRSA